MGTFCTGHYPSISFLQMSIPCLNLSTSNLSCGANLKPATSGVNLFRSLGVVDPVTEIFYFIRNKFSQEFCFSHQLKKNSFLQKNFCFLSFTPTFLAIFSRFLEIKPISNILSVQNLGVATLPTLPD